MRTRAHTPWNTAPHNAAKGRSSLAKNHLRPNAWNCGMMKSSTEPRAGVSAEGRRETNCVGGGGGGGDGSGSGGSC